MAKATATATADQAEGLRRLAGELRAGFRDALRARALARGVRVIAVTSGKGGVGKTNLTVNLALALLQQGQRVLVVDADLGLANANLVLGTTPAWHLGDVLQGRCLLAEAVHTGPGGLRLLAGGTALEELAAAPASQVASLLRQLAEVAREAEIVLLDCGAGLGGQVRALLAAAPEALVVVTPEPTSLADAYATLKAIARENPGARVSLVVNQAEGAGDAQRVSRALVRAAHRHLGMAAEPLGMVPRDAAVARAVRERRPFLLAEPEAPASRAVRALAARLAPPAAGRGGARPAASGAAAGTWGGFLTRLLIGGRGEVR